MLKLNDLSYFWGVFNTLTKNFTVKNIITPQAQAIMINASVVIFYL
jgi:hypothetical protein